jgi:hypothetical protein
MALLIAGDWHRIETLEKRLEKTSPKNDAQKIKAEPRVSNFGGIG